MKKAIGKILTLILSMISFGAFLFTISIFASYYIDPYQDSRQRAGGSGESCRTGRGRCFPFGWQCAD